jgi:hypothetical protein
MEQSPSWEAHSHSSSQAIPRLLWTPRFITVFTTARHWYLSWARCIKSTPSRPISQISSLIWSSHVRLARQVTNGSISLWKHWITLYSSYGLGVILIMYGVIWGHKCVVMCPCWFTFRFTVISVNCPSLSKHPLFFERTRVRISDRKPIFLTEAIRGFPQSLQENSGIVYWSMLTLLSSRSLTIHNHT